ncbi:unnamed protein product [Prunus armeniaca]
MISTISRSPTLAGPSNRLVKQYVRAVHYSQVFGIETSRHRKFSNVGWEPITFREEEEGIIYPHDDLMIIRAEIADCDVERVLIDTGSLVNVIFADAFRGMRIADSQVNRQITPLLSFSGDLVQPVGSINLPIMVPPSCLETVGYFAPRVRGRLNRVVRGLRLKLINGPLRPARNAARMDLVSPRPARIAA